MRNEARRAILRRFLTATDTRARPRAKSPATPAIGGKYGTMGISPIYQIEPMVTIARKPLARVEGVNVAAHVF